MSISVSLGATGPAAVQLENTIVQAAGNAAWGVELIACPSHALPLREESSEQIPAAVSRMHRESEVLKA